MADLDRSLEVHNPEDQYLHSKTSEQECKWTIDYLRSASLQVTGLQVHLQQLMALHLPLLDRLITAMGLIRQQLGGRRISALLWKTALQVRLPRKTALLRHRRIVHLALRLPNSDLLHRRHRVPSNTATISSPLILMHFPATPSRSDLVSAMVRLHQSPRLCATMPTIRIHRQRVDPNRSPSLLRLTMAALLVQ